MIIHFGTTGCGCYIVQILKAFHSIFLCTTFVALSLPPPLLPPSLHNSGEGVVFFSHPCPLQFQKGFFTSLYCTLPQWETCLGEPFPMQWNGPTTMTCIPITGDTKESHSPNAMGMTSSGREVLQRPQTPSTLSVLYSS